MNVLHLASFTGNIGDEANHRGFRRKLESNLGIKINYTNLEIRNFYRSWNKTTFDQDFVDLCNKNDLVVIGGGNFFELCWDYSVTGTTIDITTELLEKIKTPILFNGLGVDDGKGTNENNINKFREFLNYILHSDRFIFSVRNDGSIRILKKYFSDLNLDKVFVVPDGGFFIDIDSVNFKHIEVKRDRINLGINLAGDMVKIRFGNDDNYNEFCKRFGAFLTNTLSYNEMIDVVFLPHMYCDLKIISDVFNYVKDEYRRSRIVVAPLLNGTLNGGYYIFSLYSKMDLILGMRFHSNVCAIGQCIPNIGLITYHKHQYLFDELHLPDRALQVNKISFFDELVSKLRQDLTQLDKIRERYENVNLILNNDIDKFHVIVKEWITSNGKLRNI